jgi:predicted alpha/beta superfamily hydrolase
MFYLKVRMIIVLAMSCVVLTCPIALAQGQLVIPEMQTHTIESKFVDQTFEIYVQVPMSKANGSERFPVLYLADCYKSIPIYDMTTNMSLGGDIPRFIIVGIGYKTDHLIHLAELRNRDLTQVEVPSEGPNLSVFFKDVPKLNHKKKSGGASDFLKFIRRELQPFIDKNYPTIPEDRGYWGDSLGGLFGLYVLFNSPDTFNRYIIGSPSIWWGDMAIMKDAKRYIDSHDSLNAKVFMGVGALEDATDADLAKYAMVTNLFQLEGMLRKANLSGLELTTHLFPNETHSSVIAMNYIRGVQSVYTRPKPEEHFLTQMMAGLMEKE